MDDCVRVLHVITGLQTGGAETMLSRLVSAMDATVMQSHVVAIGQGGPIARRLADSGIPVTVLGVRTLPSPRQVGMLAHVMRDFRPHVVQGWLTHGNVVATALVLTSVRRKVRLSWSIHQALYDLSYEPRGTRLSIRLGALLSRFADAIVYNAAIAAQQHEDLGFHRDARLVIPNGFDIERFRPDVAARREVRATLGISEATPLIGLVARYHAMKDHETFLQAAARLAATMPDVRFVLAGGGVDEGNLALATSIERHGLRGRVYLLGERTDTERVYAALDILTLTSYTESFPLVLGEAMSCGVPCVTTDVGEAAHIVGDAGFVVPIRDPAAVAGAWQRVLDLPPLHQQALGRSARQRIVDNWPLSSVVAEYRGLYQRLAGVTSASTTNSVAREEIPY